jgi:hypothetical protein
VPGTGFNTLSAFEAHSLQTGIAAEAGGFRQLARGWTEVELRLTNTCAQLAGGLNPAAPGSEAITCQDSMTQIAAASSSGFQLLRRQRLQARPFLTQPAAPT